MLTTTSEPMHSCDTAFFSQKHRVVAEAAREGGQAHSHGSQGNDDAVEKERRSQQRFEVLIFFCF